MKTDVRSLGLFVVLVVVTATHAFAGQNWEIEAHGGVLTSTNPENGTSTLPAIGPNIPLNVAIPTSITRQVPSWYFGDGAAILNEILGARSPARIARSIHFSKAAASTDSQAEAWGSASIER